MHTPIWELFQDGKENPVHWTDHTPNRRFAIYNPGDTRNPDDDLVLDKETGLIWPRNANLFIDPNTKANACNWLDANTTCRNFTFANRQGWRLPTVEELSSLVDTRNSSPSLPTGHPFVSVKFGADNPVYWTSTNSENPGGAAWFINLNGPNAGGGVGLSDKAGVGFVWPVRGGHGGVNWNW